MVSTTYFSYPNFFYVETFIVLSGLLFLYNSNDYSWYPLINLIFMDSLPYLLFCIYIVYRPIILGIYVLMIIKANARITKCFLSSFLITFRIIKLSLGRAFVIFLQWITKNKFSLGIRSLKISPKYIKLLPSIRMVGNSFGGFGAVSWMIQCILAVSLALVVSSVQCQTHITSPDLIKLCYFRIRHECNDDDNEHFVKVCRISDLEWTLNVNPRFQYFGHISLQKSTYCLLKIHHWCFGYENSNSFLV